MECITATYSLNTNGSVKVDNRGIYNHKMYQDIGVATLASDDGSGKLEVMFPASSKFVKSVL